MYIALNTLPRYIKIDLRQTYALVDRLASDTRLPTIDTEAVLSALVDVLYKPDIGGASASTIQFVTNEIVGVNSSDDRYYQLIRGELTTALLALLREFKQFQLYAENRLLYDYDRRFSYTTALLRRKDTICL